MTRSHMSPEQLQIENFSVSCNDVCASPSISSDLKAACDEGTYQYCIQSGNVSSNQCIDFMDRIVRTRAAQRTNSVYANPVKISASSQTIDNTIFSDAINYVGRNVVASDQTVVNKIVNTLTPEPNMLLMMSSASLKTCDAANQNSSCASKQWVIDGLSKFIDLAINDPASASIDNALKFATPSVVSAYDNYLVKYYNFLLSLVSLTNITNADLLKTYRANSAYMREKLDLIVLNYILGNTLTSIPRNKDGSYNIDISAKSNLYDPKVRAYYNSCAAISSVDNFVVAVASADTTNIARCASVDPTKDTTCIAMKATGDAALSGAVDSSLNTYCMNSANIGSDSCAAYVNNLMTTNPNVDKNAIFKTALIAATNKDGTLNKTIISKFNGMKDWLLVKTSDSITTDTNGTKSISTTCGTSSGLSIDQCKQVCAAYPDMCVNDQIARCQMPMYRYAETFEALSPTIQESFGEKASDSWLYVLIFIVICIGIFYVRKRYLARQGVDIIESFNDIL
jgi:hypothetical protein